MELKKVIKKCKQLSMSYGCIPDEFFHLTEIDKAMVEKGIGVDVQKFKQEYYNEWKRY